MHFKYFEQISATYRPPEPQKGSRAHNLPNLNSYFWKKIRGVVETSRKEGTTQKTIKRMDLKIVILAFGQHVNFWFHFCLIKETGKIELEDAFLVVLFTPFGS